MSVNFFLCCPEVKEYVWIGQGMHTELFTKLKMDVFYSGEEGTMDGLHFFLNKTKGKNLVLKTEHDEEVLGHYKDVTKETEK